MRVRAHTFVKRPTSPHPLPRLPPHPITLSLPIPPSPHAILPPPSAPHFPSPLHLSLRPRPLPPTSPVISLANPHHPPPYFTLASPPFCEFCQFMTARSAPAAVGAGAAAGALLMWYKATSTIFPPAAVLSVLMAQAAAGSASGRRQRDRETGGSEVRCVADIDLDTQSVGWAKTGT